jgi:hypothetical protein
MAVGMGLAFLFAGAIHHILFEVDAQDPLIFGGVPPRSRSWAWLPV